MLEKRDRKNTDISSCDSVASDKKKSAWVRQNKEKHEIY